MITSEFPELPWQKLGTDLFTWKGFNYLLVINYYSRYIEIAKLHSTSSISVINYLSSIFGQHSIPNGPQYKSIEFSNFAKAYGFQHKTSSPRFPQSNGEAERAVKTVKQLLSKSSDPYLALLAYRASPLNNGYSPSELLMGRRLRTTVPVLPEVLEPKLPDKERVGRETEEVTEESL